MRSVRIAALATLALVVWVFSCGKGGGGPGDPRDVRGNYAVTYDNRLKLTLNLGGAVREVTQSGYGGIVDFGVVNGQSATLDLTQFCAKSEVTCPSEAFWAKVAVDQPDLSKNQLDLQQLQVIDDTVHTLPAGQKAAAAAGLVDHAQEDRFLLGLGLGGGTAGSCAALGISFAQGRFSHVGERFEPVTVYRTPSGAACTPSDGGTDAGRADGGADGGTADAGVPPACNPVQIQRLVVPPGAAVDGIAEGKVVLAWAGGCAFGPFLAGATLVAETGYTASRTGNFDPPPFTPAPVVLPDGGLPDGGASDGGTDGGSDGGTDGGSDAGNADGGDGG